MRTIKQSNSMKELLKKLKRHDTLVLASGVVVASLLCGAFVYVTTPAISADAAQEEVRRDSLGVQKKASDQLKEIESYLEKLDKVVTESQEIVKDVQTVQNNQKEINEKTLESQKTLSTEKNTNTNSTKVVEKISGLDKALESIHSEISTTNTQIKELKTSMDKGGNKDPNKDKESFAQITNALNDIQKSCDKQGTNVSSIIEQLKNSKSDNSEKQKNMISSLETIVKSLEKVETKETLTKMESDLKETQTTYVNMLDNVEKNVNKTSESVKKVGDKVNKVAENINNVENNMNEVRDAQKNANSRMDTIGNDIGSVKGEVGNVSTLLGSVDGKIGNVEGKIGSVGEQIGSVGEQIGSVGEQIGSVGEQIGTMQENIGGLKNSLADTNAKIDALSGELQSVFQNSDSNRKKLASVLYDVCGYQAAEDASFYELIEAVKLIPAKVMKSGNVTYERHYHKDARGREVKDRTTQRGGCFTSPVYHVHTSDCYEIIRIQRERRPEDPINVTPYDTKEVLKCKKNKGTVDAWEPGCGHRHGEIVKAVINFGDISGKAANAVNTSMAYKPGEVQINEDLFNFDGFSEEEVIVDDTPDMEEEQQESTDASNEDSNENSNEGEPNVETPDSEKTTEEVPEDNSNGGDVQEDNQPDTPAAVSDGNSEG